MYLSSLLSSSFHCLIGLTLRSKPCIYFTSFYSFFLSYFKTNWAGICLSISLIPTLSDIQHTLNKPYLFTDGSLAVSNTSHTYFLYGWVRWFKIHFTNTPFTKAILKLHQEVAEKWHVHASENTIIILNAQSSLSGPLLLMRLYAFFTVSTMRNIRLLQDLEN